jgi:hypothetical protein
MSRRSFVQIGAAGIASLGLADIDRARALGATSAHGGGGKNTSIILIWLDGGPSHLDMYDMKPDAPSEYRGIWSPIKTNAPGIEITEMYPLQAQCADKFSIIRSIHHDNGDHFTGGHWMLTGHGGVSGADTAGRSPFVGAIATKVTGARKPGLLPHVAIPYAMSIGLRPGYFGGNYLGDEFNPFETGGDPNASNFKVQNLALPKDLTIDRLEDRRGLLKHFDQLKRTVDESGALNATDRFQQKAYDLVVGGEVAAAFDLTREDDKTRDRYGRTPWGQSALLARRLVAAGCTFVTVHLGGWDHHWDIQKGYDRYLPQVDSLVSALFEDLSARGLLDQVMVMLCGEFGRTPKMNDGGNGGPALSMGQPGRDHWGNAMSVLIGGGGVKGGRVVGSTDRRGERPKDRPLLPGDLHATMFHVLGVDPRLMITDRVGRPVPAIAEGNVIGELF